MHISLKQIMIYFYVDISFIFEISNHSISQGCYEKAKDLVLSQSDIILGMGFAFSLSMVSCLIKSHTS